MCLCIYRYRYPSAGYKHVCVRIRYMCIYINSTSGLVFHFRTQFTPRRSHICVCAYKNLRLHVCAPCASPLWVRLRTPRPAEPRGRHSPSPLVFPRRSSPAYGSRLLLGGRPHPRTPSAACRALPAESRQTHPQSPRVPASRPVPSRPLTPGPPELSLPPLPGH